MSNPGPSSKTGERPSKRPRIESPNASEAHETEEASLPPNEDLDQQPDGEVLQEHAQVPSENTPDDITAHHQSLNVEPTLFASTGPYRLFGDLYLPQVDDPVNGLPANQLRRFYELEPLIRAFEERMPGLRHAQDTSPTGPTTAELRVEEKEFFKNEVAISKRPAEYLIRFSGEVTANVGLQLHYPSFWTSIPSWGEIADWTTPVLRNVMHCGFTKERCFLFDTFCRREKSRKADKYSPELSKCHIDWHYRVRDSLHAKVMLVFGKPNRNLLLNGDMSVSWPFERLHLWGQFQDIDAVLEYYPETLQTVQSIRRITIFIPHPAHLYWLKFAGRSLTVGRKMDAACIVAGKLGKIPVDETYWQRMAIKAQLDHVSDTVKHPRTLDQIRQDLKEMVETQADMQIVFGPEDWPPELRGALEGSATSTDVDTRRRNEFNKTVSENRFRWLDILSRPDGVEELSRQMHESWAKVDSGVYSEIAKHVCTRPDKMIVAIMCECCFFRFPNDNKARWWKKHPEYYVTHSTQNCPSESCVLTFRHLIPIDLRIPYIKGYVRNLIIPGLPKTEQREYSTRSSFGSRQSLNAARSATSDTSSSRAYHGNMSAMSVNIGPLRPERHPEFFRLEPQYRIKGFLPIKCSVCNTSAATPKSDPVWSWHSPAGKYVALPQWCVPCKRSTEHIPQNPKVPFISGVWDGKQLDKTKLVQKPSHPAVVEQRKPKPKQQPKPNN